MADETLPETTTDPQNPLRNVRAAARLLRVAEPCHAADAGERYEDADDDSLIEVIETAEAVSCHR